MPRRRRLGAGGLAVCFALSATLIAHQPQHASAAGSGPIATWGDDGIGQLGVPASCVLSPVQVAGITGAVSVAGGSPQSLVATNPGGAVGVGIELPRTTR